MAGAPSAGRREGLSGERAARGGLRQPLLLSGWGSRVPSARPLRPLPWLMHRVTHSAGHAGTCSVTGPGGRAAWRRALPPAQKLSEGQARCLVCLEQLL